MELPKFKLANVAADGTAEEPQLFSVEKLPLETTTGRRGFLGAGLTALALFANRKLFSNKNYIDKDLLAHESGINGLYFNNTGETLLSVTSRELKLWSLASRKLLGKVSDIYINAVTMAPNNQHFSLVTEKRIEIRSLKNASLIKSISKDEYLEAKALMYTPRGHQLVALLRKREVRCWNCDSWQEIPFFPSEISKEITNMLYTPDGKYLITIESPESKSDYRIMQINIRSAANGKLIKQLREFNKSIYVDTLLLVSNDSRRLFFIEEKNRPAALEIWNLQTLEKDYTYKLKENRAVALSADGLRVFIEADYFIEIWQSPMLSRVQRNIAKMLAVSRYEELKEPVIELCKHAGMINSIAVSPVGTIVASGDSRGVIKLSDWTKQECQGYLFDPRANQSDGVSYNVYDKVTGNTISYTMPCGSPIPSGAVCTCNCVAGTYKPPPPPSHSNDGRICSCVPVCICMAV
ncbi:MAG TPA: WD40 repeat domain-containing protein [Chitinophagaceae bacterium]|nr:WD40 repeat domain-containing protein [Chitinophagaceae bacterium]